MTNEQINRAIAEACGFVCLNEFQVDKNGARFPFWEYPETWTNPKKQLWLPDFCNDLNAMHEAEKVLTEINWFTYISELAQIVRLPKQPEVQIKQSIHATARQRAEAFLRTLCKRKEVQK